MKYYQSLLATVIDDRPESLRFAKAMFSSAYISGWSGKYLILYCGKNIKRFQSFERKNILIKQVQSPFQSQDEWLNLTTWNKLHLFSKEYLKYRPIIYLDADLLVYDNFHFIDSIKYFGAVRNHHSEEICSGKIHNCILKEILGSGLNIDYNLPQFNAGVFVIGTHLNQDLLENLITLTLEIKNKCILRDQSILNVFFKNWEQLPQQYNYGAEVILEDLHCGRTSNYSIIHFWGHYYEVFKKEFERFSKMFNNIDFTTPINPTKKSEILFSENKEKVIKINRTLYNTLKRAWRYAYNYDSEFKKRNPDPNKINSNEKIRVPGWLASII